MSRRFVEAFDRDGVVPIPDHDDDSEPLPDRYRDPNIQVFEPELLIMPANRKKPAKKRRGAA